MGSPGFSVPIKNGASIVDVKIVRFLVMCILAFAIPLQGMAAVTQMFCHGGGASVIQAPVDQAHPQAADHHHDQTKSADHQASKADAVKSLNHKCSTCAQCFFGTALLPAPIKLIPSQEVSIFVATSNELLGEFSPSNLERPPRSFLA